jgi:hypothetical protein
MWVWAVRCAVLLNNITACYFSRERVWATPYELLHGEPFPDVSIVVPFGCAALVFRVFHNRCTLLIFIHYADEHSMCTYAFYSPLTKRVLYRQDCIFLPEIFPMRTARQAAGLRPEGEPLVSFRSPLSMRVKVQSQHSFQNWSSQDPLPEFEDHVSGRKIAQPVSSGI